ncbi:MAG: uncharacterized protein KVP18_003868 [Porospora cf. gigantea A]|uniref:uncharacterized protein n=1 Tax=Porospora cf. gigantea A TaxID=2853593 RepID=UPI00355A3D94|nr:MAG: hypothetical protein KVP18_003868 [Porospora cf. gigantea A]
MVASTFIQRTRLWKVNLMLIEYPGYGLATGEPSEEGVYAAADAAYHWLTRKQGLPASSIIVHGRSLGSGPACHLAAKYPVGGLVFQSGFMSILRVNFGVKAQFFGDLFQNHLKFPLIFCPVFFIHGIQDSTIPFDHAKILYDKHFQAGREVVRPLWVQSADHNDLEVRYAKYATCVGYFLEYIRTLEEMNCEALDDSPKHKHRNPPVGPDEYPLSPIQELRSPPRMPVRTPLQRPATPLRRPVEERRRPVTHGLPPSPLRKPARKARRAKEPPSVEHSKSPKGERKRKQRPIKSVYSFEQIGDLTKSLIELKPVVEPSTAARNESHPNVAGKGESDSIPVPLVSNAARVVSSMPDVFIPTVRPPEPVVMTRDEQGRNCKAAVVPSWVSATPLRGPVLTTTPLRGPVLTTTPLLAPLPATPLRAPPSTPLVGAPTPWAVPRTSMMLSRPSDTSNQVAESPLRFVHRDDELFSPSRGPKSARVATLTPRPGPHPASPTEPSSGVQRVPNLSPRDPSTDLQPTSDTPKNLPKTPLVQEAPGDMASESPTAFAGLRHNLSHPNGLQKLEDRSRQSSKETRPHLRISNETRPHVETRLSPLLKPLRRPISAPDETVGEIPATYPLPMSPQITASPLVRRRRVVKN